MPSTWVPISVTVPSPIRGIHGSRSGGGAAPRSPSGDGVRRREGRRRGVRVVRPHPPGYERTFVERALDFYTAHRFELTDGGELVKLEVSDDARAGVYRDHLLVRTRSPWLGHPAGALLAADYPAFLAGSREFTVLFTPPDEHTSLEQYAWTRNHLLVVTLRDVQTEVRVLTPGPDGWEDRPLDGVPPATSTSIIDVDPLESDDFFLNSSGFTVPATLLSGTVGGPLTAIKQAPSFFDAENIAVTQHFATSDDGTQVPYFVVGSNTDTPVADLAVRLRRIRELDGAAYGGGVGRAWLERGHTYVIANIRGGGGEYGPTWHTQALKENRHKVFEDFAAVAKDLVARGGVTTAEQLGIQGGSNGGLLMGVMLTRYPSLFGGAIVCQVPLLDMKRYHLLLAGASWMAEYGDPRQPGGMGVPERVLAVSEHRPGRDVSTDPDHHVHPRRPGASRSRPQDGRAARGAGTRGVVLREHRGGGHGGVRRTTRRPRSNPR